MIVESTVAPGRSGPSSVVAETVAEDLKMAGHEVLVVTTTRGNGLAKTELVRYDLGAIPVIAVTVTGPVRTTRDYVDHGVEYRFRQVMRFHRPDVVLFHDVQQFGLSAVRDAVALGVPAVVLMSDAWWMCERHDMIRSTNVACGQASIDIDVCSTCVADLAKLGRAHADVGTLLNAVQSIAVTDEAWRLLVKSMGVRDDLIRVLDPTPSVAPATARSPRDWARPVRLGFVGDTSDQSGMRSLISALRRIRRSDFELSVLDPSSVAGAARQQRRLWPVSGLVRVRTASEDPAVDIASLSGFLRDHDVLVSPSASPASLQPVVSLAATLGLWVVACGVAGLPTTLQDGVNATILDARDLERVLPRALNAVLDREPLAGGAQSRRHSPAPRSTLEEVLVGAVGAQGVRLGR